MAKLKAIDFFCSIGGMTYGFKKAGINVIAGIDVDHSCKETYEHNNPGSKFIEADIKEYSFKELKTDTKIKRNDDDLVFIGCSPCQYWSIIKTIKTKSNLSKNLLSDFQRFVAHFKPGFVVVENVPGIMKRAKESGINKFISFLKKLGYVVKYDILNANHYGVPQNRRRFTLIASRVNLNVSLPKGNKNRKYIVKNFIGERNGFPKIEAGHIDNTKFKHSAAGLSDNNLKRIKLTKKNGGTRERWANNKKLQIDAYKGKDSSFKNVYGRMSWDKPAPTITTRFNSLSNGRFGHPEEDRALSLREGATLQTFPKLYNFKEKSMGKIARHIGNAVPPKFAKKIAKQIINHHLNVT
ncbi:MAG: DNA cytosine methyltransferase [Bacteroidetes bacterium]|nr:DNA cytosine methyltransferase [Bacteroidota bacterium]